MPGGERQRPGPAESLRVARPGRRTGPARRLSASGTPGVRPDRAQPWLVDEAAPRRVLIVEDHNLLAHLLVVTLGQEGIVADRAPMRSHEEILAACRAGSYDVVVLDLDLGESLGESIPLIRPLQETGARVIMLTAVDDRRRHAECFEAGAIGLVTKDEEFDSLIAALVTP